MALLDLFQCQAARLLHQIDEPEVSRGENDRISTAYARRVVAVGGCRARRLFHSVAHHRVVFLPARERGRANCRDGAAHEVGEVVAVPLPEGRALRLSVVGQDDELIRPRGVAPRPVDPSELLVELAQRLEGVGPLQPRVVGDLVVARERRVHHRPPFHHVGKHAEDDQVTHGNAHRRAHEGIGAAPVAARADVAARATSGRRPLQHDLPEEEDEQARDVEAVCKEDAVTGIRTLLLGDPADREDRVLCLTGEQVAATRSALPEQAHARGAAALDLGTIVRFRAGHRAPAFLLDPAKGGNVLVRAEQDACLTRARLRREVGLPLGEQM